jgi:hypothetical protein
MELKSKKIYINERLGKLMKRMRRANCGIGAREGLKDALETVDGGENRRRRNRERAGQCLGERVEAEWWKKTR